MTSAWLHGQRTKALGQEKYICRLQEKGRTRRRHSNFWIGLYGESWLTAFEYCKFRVEEMLNLIANKKSFYQKGLRAISLIDQPLKRLGRPLKWSAPRAGVGGRMWGVGTVEYGSWKPSPPQKIQFEMDASYTLTIIHCYKSGTQNAPTLHD